MSFAVGLVGVDSAGGLLVSTAQSHVLFNGSLAAQVGSVVTPHGTGSHAAATVSGGAAAFRINGVPVARTSSSASCGHVLTGSSHVKVDT